MTSRKQRRYGSGGSKHKQTPNAERQNGKAWKIRGCGKRHSPLTVCKVCAKRLRSAFQNSEN